MALNNVSLVYSYFADPEKSQAISEGDCYIGNPDTDPEIGGNQKQVYHRQENGSDVPVSQPLQTGAGGVILINGSPAQIVVEGNYSIKVLDKSGAQKYYDPDRYDGEPVTQDQLPISVSPSGGDDTTAIQDAVTQAAGSNIIFTPGSYTVSSTISSSTGICFVGNSATINGGDFLGFSVSGGNICFSGRLVFDGFQDAGNPQDQQTNFTTGIVRISSGSTIVRIYVGPGVEFKNSRSGIMALSTTNDFTPDMTIQINSTLVDGLVTDGVIMPANIRCNYGPVNCVNSEFKNCIGAGREVTAFQAFIDGLSTPDLGFYSTVGPVRFENNTVDTVIQKTTTGDSTVGNSYECVGFRSSGKNVQCHNNTFKDVTGVDFDCEAVYTKSIRYGITNNRFENSGTEEGAINAKGVGPADFAATENAPGYEGIITDNTIYFDAYTYDHGGGVVENLSCTGINCSGIMATQIENNLIIGSNNFGIRCLGSNERNQDADINGNVIKDNFGAVGIYLRGAFENLNVCENVMDTQATNSNAFVRFILYETTETRGVNRNNNRINGNTLKFEDSAFTGTLALVDLQMDDYSFNILECNDNIYDATVNASATQSPMNIQWGGNGTLIGIGDRFEMKGWKFSKVITSDTFQPIRWVANLRVRSYDISIKLLWETTDDSTFTAMQAQVFDSNSIGAEMSYVASRTDALGNVLMEQRQIVGYDNAGTVTTSAGTTLYSETIGTTAGVSTIFSPSTQFLRCRVNGNAAETWRFDIDCRFRTIDGETP